MPTWNESRWGANTEKPMRDNIMLISMMNGWMTRQMSSFQGDDEPRYVGMM